MLSQRLLGLSAPFVCPLFDRLRGEIGRVPLANLLRPRNRNNVGYKNITLGFHGLVSIVVCKGITSGKFSSASISAAT